MNVVALVFPKTVYVAFFVSELARLVYIRARVAPDAQEEDVVHDIRTQLHNNGVRNAEPADDYVLLDEVPHPSHSIVGTVEDIVYKINQGEI